MGEGPVGLADSGSTGYLRWRLHGRVAARSVGDRPIRASGAFPEWADRSPSTT